jgi:pimeloyl-ACP methyl ester carboxylesterase
VVWLFWFLIASGVVVAAIVALHVLSWILYAPLAARILGEPPLLVPESGRPRWDGEEVCLTTADGVRLRGTYLPTRTARRQGVVVFCHELYSDRWAIGTYLRGVRNRGFDVFTFDFRNHGESDTTPNYKPTPWVTEAEIADLRAVLDYLHSRNDADPRGVALVGVSRGGTAAFCVAADDPRVRAVVVDGLVPTERLQIHYARRFLRVYTRSSWLYNLLPDMSFRPIGAIARSSVQRKRGCRFVSVDQAARRLRRPVLFIHGSRDPFVPLAVAREVADLIPRPVRFWTVRGAKHNASVKVQTQGYRRRLVRFLERHLGEPGRFRRAEPFAVMDEVVEAVPGTGDAWADGLLAGEL